MVPACSRSRAPDRKSVLFCPECDHESPVDGDWNRQTDAGGVVYRCPVCDADLTVRPAGRAPGAGARGPAGGSVVARSVGLAASSLRLAVVWTAWPYTPGHASGRSRSH